MRKPFGKQIALLLTAVVAFGAVGCGKEKAQTPETGVQQEETGDTPQTTAAVDTLENAYIMADNAPTITAKSAILVTQETGTILYEKNGKEKMYPASMTKMITALVVMDHFSEEELVVVGTEINEVTLDSSKAGHVLGETLTIKNLVRGLIIPSGNDSANVLAMAVAKRTQENENLSFSQSEAVFADLMNAKAKELGAVNSHFTNAHGYHDENHYSCAYDMALFARAYMKDAALVEIANEKNFVGNGADGMFANDATVKTQNYAWRSHNLLITENEYNYGYASGIKTGFTDEAGDCVSATAKKDGDILIGIVFHAEDPARWVDAKNLFEFGFNSYAKVQLGDKGGIVEEVTLTKNNRLEGDTVPVVYGRNVSAYLPIGAENRLSKTSHYGEPEGVENKDGTFSLKAPLVQGAKVGTVSYEIDGKTVLTEDVYAGRDVAKGSIWSNIQYFFKNFFAIVFSMKGLIGLGVIVAVAVIAFLAFRFFGGRKRRYSGGYSLQNSAKRKKFGKGRRRF